MLSDFSETQHEGLLGETLGCAILDSGCTSTVCGETWLTTYLDTLSNNELNKVTEHSSNKHFRFGDGKIFKSLKSVNLPIHTGSQKSHLLVDVVNCEIPLLLSNSSLKKANANLDFGSNQIMFLGENIPVKTSKSGHFFIRLSRTASFQSQDAQRILFTSPLDVNDLTDTKKKISKLHKQFAHPQPDKLKKLIHDSGIADSNINNIIQEVTNTCEICQKFKKPPSRPVVAFPTATSFCEVVAMDLKDVNDFKILHMIDHATRYSSACIIPNKKKETIVKAIMENWISIFGAPKYFLTDNGGEFVNDEMIQLAEQFNITLKTTAAESPWSNGLCERHNEILADSLRKVQSDNNCSVQTSLHWALAAKNSLTNVYGFSPNQLVFGKNIELPSVHKDKLPAGNTSSDYIMKNLNALHSARQAFIQQESSEKLRRALNRKTRGYSNQSFQINDNVYYHRNKSKKWHGPAKVLGKDGQQHLLKHGGVYIRVHPCRMQLCNPQTNEILEDEEKTSSVPINNDSNINSNNSDTKNDEEEQARSSSDTDDNYEPVNEEHIGSNSDTETPNPPEINRKTKLALKRIQDFNNPGLKEGTQLTVTTDEVQDDSIEDVLFGTKTDGSRFDAAKTEELNKWREMDTYEEVDDEGQPTLSCRWVCTEKVKGKVLVAKARLVVRGFEEDTTQIQTDSPTCNKESVRILLAILSGNRWDMHTMDIKNAFLQGNDIQRETFLRPPKFAKTNKIWKLKKTPYGLSDAGRQWYVRVLKELLSLGAIQSSYDKAAFVWYKDNSTMGVMVLHVDDFLYGGSEEFLKNIITKIRKIFIVGLEETNNFKYLGLHISQQPDYIEMSTKGYAAGCSEIPTSPLGLDRDRNLTPSELTSLKQLSGQLNWVTTQSRPDLAFENCMVGNSLKKPTVRDIFTANRVLRRLGDHEFSLFFPRLHLQSCMLIGFCDASFANLPDSGSQGAYIIFLIDENGLYCPLAWQSRRIRRVVHSTIAAECLSAVEVAETCIYLGRIIQELIGKESRLIPIHIFCDNKSLIDQIHSTTSVENKRLRIDISVLRDMHHNGEIQQFKWVPTDIQVANALTKKGCSSFYLSQILQGRLRFNISSGSFNQCN